MTRQIKAVAVTRQRGIRRQSICERVLGKTGFAIEIAFAVRVIAIGWFILDFNTIFEIIKFPSENILIKKTDDQA